ncbi:hypothetical protein NQ317_002124 [Molorchus minor]|uniref:Uncharacterized protein n=1 Tax=Molorchus minor TaxID=1323400 RepID=A0ABQ9JX11_9CUCU|nr:hypothetical protein NQ317_002124 [Molorchus minor]
MNNPMNGPQMSGPHGPHGPSRGLMDLAGRGYVDVDSERSNWPSMNNNFIMSPMNNMYSRNRCPCPPARSTRGPADGVQFSEPERAPIYPCGVCHKEVHDNDQAILCESGCNFWFHRLHRPDGGRLPAADGRGVRRVGLRQVLALQEHTARQVQTLVSPILREPYEK